MGKFHNNTFLTQTMLHTVSILFASLIEGFAVVIFIKKQNCIYRRLPSFEEPALIRIIRLFELRSSSPWICLPNSGKKHSRVLELLLFELSVNRTDFYSLLGQLYTKSPSVIRIFIIGRLSSENIDFLRLKHFFL